MGDTDGTGFGIGVVCPLLLRSLHSVVCTIRSLSLLQAPSSQKHPASSMAATRKVRAATKQASEVRKKDSKPMVAQSEANNEEQEQKSPMESVPGSRPSTPPPRSEAFEQFKQERGSEINKILLLNKGEHQYGNETMRCVDCIISSLSLRVTSQEAQGSPETLHCHQHHQEKD